MSPSRNQIVSLLRVVALLCILMHHSMCMYHGWPPISWEWGELLTFSFEDIVSNGFKIFGLGTFTFISGFVLYYQKGKNKSYLQFIRDKVIRLAIPCICFGIAYKIFFPTMMFDNAPINGTHLWYIPMIFVCIIVTSCQLFKPKLWWVTLGLYLVVIKAQSYFSFRTLWEFVHYYPIFFMGYLFNVMLNGSEELLGKINQPFLSRNIQRLVVILCILSVPIFSKLVPRCYIDGSSISIGALILCIYVMMGKVRMRNRGGVLYCSHKKIAKVIDKNSFAIYLLHQFIINLCLINMYDFLNQIPTFLGSCMVCCISLICALCIAELYDKILTRIKIRIM